MSRLFSIPVLSKDPQRRIRQIGLFGILPIELTLMIFEYVIKTSHFTEIVRLMHTCKFIRVLLREHLSTEIQTKLPEWIRLTDYKIISNLINYSTEHIGIKAKDYDSEWSILNKFKFVAISSIYNGKVLGIPPKVKQLMLFNVTGFDWSLTTQLTHLILKHLSMSMWVLDDILKRNKNLQYLHIEEVSGIRRDDINYIEMFYPKIKVRYRSPQIYGVTELEAISAVETSILLNTFHSYNYAESSVLLRRLKTVVFRTPYIDQPDTSFKDLLPPKRFYEPVLRYNLRYKPSIYKSKKFIWTNRLVK